VKTLLGRDPNRGCNMRRILVAVDGSEPSLHALQQALEIADKTKAKVTCAYVVPPPFYPPEAIYVPTQEYLAMERRLGEEALARAKELAEKSGAQVDTLTLQGSPGDAIVAASEKSPDTELVVVGSRGRNAVARVLLGSVADRVVHLSKKPVLVVR
jgi:nucleotide-binding universal stress UspA family protein